MTDQPPTVAVPREPTEAMCQAARDKIVEAHAGGWAGLDVIDIYRAMLSAGSAQSPAALDEAVGLLREALERVGFEAGWAARTRAIDQYLMHDVTPDVEAAWSQYEPQGAPVAADVLIDRLQERLDSYAGNTRAYVDVLDLQALINRARLAPTAEHAARAFLANLEPSQ